MKVVQISWNFVRIHKILNQKDAENFSFLSWKTKKVLFLEKICGMLVIETFKSQVSDFLNSSTCFCSRLYGMLNCNPQNLSRHFSKKWQMIWSKTSKNKVFFHNNGGNEWNSYFTLSNKKFCIWQHQIKGQGRPERNSKMHQRFQSSFRKQFKPTKSPPFFHHIIDWAPR